MKNKKFKNFQGGLAPLLIIAIVAVLAVGGGAYLSKKNRNAKKMQAGDNIETRANANADLNANENANLGVNANANAISAKGTLRSLLTLGKDTSCTFNYTDQGVTSTGTVFISSEGSMRGEFQTTYQGKTTDSDLILVDKTVYVWTGSQGAKMDVSEFKGDANASREQSINLDQQVEYSCSDWTIDESKFTLPTGVNFIDLNAALKSSLEGTLKTNP